MPAEADPDLALRTAKTVADIYGQAVADLLKLVASRLARGIDEPGWAERKLTDMVGLRTEAADVVARLQVFGPEAINLAVERGYEVGARAGAAEVAVKLAPATNTLAVQALAAETVAAITDTHGGILRQIDDIYRQVVAETAAQTVTGARTRLAAAQNALNHFADRGIVTFRDTAGRRWALESYAEMATRTAVGRAQVAGTLDRFTDAGRDLVIVSDAPQECKACRPWEGKVLSISGATERGTRVTGGDGARFTVAGSVAQAQRAGLQHPNCRHRLGAFVPGLTGRMADTEDPSGDRARQEQRRLERGVRHWKQRAAAALDDDARKASERKAKEWQRRLADHVQANDLQRRRERERLGPR